MKFYKKRTALSNHVFKEIAFAAYNLISTGKLTYESRLWAGHHGYSCRTGVRLGTRAVICWILLLLNFYVHDDAGAQICEMSFTGLLMDTHLLDQNMAIFHICSGKNCWVFFF